MIFLKGIVISQSHHFVYAIITSKEKKNSVVCDVDGSPHFKI